ncbi:MAG: M55 family metallopeptidase [Gemmatimonadales bacterium]
MRTLPSILLAVASAGCSVSNVTPDASRPAAEPWTLTAATPDAGDGIRILILHDMEGLSGQSDPATFDFGTPEYPTGQQLLAADINAVVEGLFAGGATEVHVVDGHGSGNPDPDVRRDLLDPRAQQLIRETDFDAYFDLVTAGAYDGVAVVGMHAKTGSRGFASHTLTLGIGVLINGREITETELVGLSWGRQRIPVIFGSGDDRLAADLGTMPWIEFVTVKTATAADSAIPRPLDDVRAELTASATRAVENLRAGRAMAMVIDGPLTAGVKAVPPASFARLAEIPGIAYADSAISFPADSLRHAYDVIGRLVGVALAGYSSALSQVVRESRDAESLRRGYGDRLSAIWFDYESGRWRAPSPPVAAPDGRKYHGYH